MALRDEVMTWLDERRNMSEFIRFSHHFDVLTVVFPRMLGGILDALDGTSRLPSSGAVYERCRELDESLIVVRRAFDWYSAKYDQRLNLGLTDALRAADEIIRSCWHSAFELRGVSPPTGPLPYFDARFDARAISRHSVPSQIRAPEDAPFSELDQTLPIPVTALPSWAADEPWWLVLAAHETGHHVQKDLHLEDQTAALLAPGWVRWSGELFADAFSVLMVRSAAITPVEELVHATPRRMMAVPEDGDKYPPPAVRLAVLRELAGMPRRAETIPAAVSPYFDAVPGVSTALLELLNDLRPAWDAQLVAAWQCRLRAKDPILSQLSNRAAARYLIAAGVTACAEATDEEQGVVTENLLRFLPECGPPGTLGPAPPQPDVDALADRLTMALVGGDE